MHVALHHDALVPPPTYGGTERVIYWLARALLELGHQVTLIAQPGSELQGGRLVAIDPRAPRAWEDELGPSVDIIHFWAPPGFEPRKPCVVTIGGIGKPGEVFHPNTVFVSRSHAENHCSRNFVYNGIDPAAYRIAPKEDFAVFLAKASWSVKNLRGAIEVARAAGLRLEVLGSRNWPLRLNRLSRHWGKVHYRGMVGDAEKREVLSRARALFFPVRWPEPFGLAVTEALASGCAVFATPYGSLPELVTPEVGFLSHRASDWVERLRAPWTFAPERCRSRVFDGGLTHIDMARRYLGFYESVLATGKLPGSISVSDRPRTREDLSINPLWPWESL